MGLEAAQAVGLINSAVLWQGQAVTLVGVSGNNAYLDTGTSSTVAPLSELSLVEAGSRLVSHNGHFTSPGVFRVVSAAEPAVCGVPAEEDPDLQVCFDPRNPENLDEILRQSGSPGEMGREGRAALLEAARLARREGREEQFKAQVRQALEEIGEENPCEFEGAQQAYAEVQATLPPSVSNGGSNAGNNAGGNGGNGSGQGAGNGGNGSAIGGNAVSYSGNGTALVAGDGAPVNDNGLGSPMVSAASFGGVEFIPAVSVLDAVTGSFGGVHNDNGADGSSSNFVPAVVRSSSVPAVLNPFTFSFPAYLSPELRAVLSFPPSDATREAAFFQAVFGPSSTERPTSDLMALLTHPTPEFAPKIAQVRGALANVVRQYEARYGAAGPADREASIPLVIRYVPENRRIEVAVDSGELPGASGRGPSSFGEIRGQFGSLAGYSLGSGDHFRGDGFGFGPIVASVYVPAQYLQGVRLGNDAIFVRADGRATERGIERVVARDSANDQHGGSRGRDREGRGSREGRDGRNPREGREGEDQELYAVVDEEPSFIAA
ncbi:MAG TPA: hypothetical protein VFX30_12560 [bacterium]|nr:hypothetical protein [bacterium]